MARGEIPLAVTRTVATVSGASAPIAIAGASVNINTRAAAPTPATIYADETGSTTLANPLITTADGRIDGWLDEGSYNLTISGSGITTYTQPLDIVSGKSILAIPGDRLVANSVVTVALAAGAVTGPKIADGTINPLKLANSVLPIGTVIQWWRPSSSVPIPTGWAPCNGDVIASVNHDFGTGSSITLPNMVNKFVMGAAPASTYGTAGDGGATGAGVNGTGGANFNNLNHAHTSNDHYHIAQGAMGTWTGNLYADDHLHGSGSLYAGNHGHHFAVGSGAGSRGIGMQIGGTEPSAFLNHAHWVEGDTGGSQPGVGGQTGAADRPLYVRGNVSGASDRAMTSALSTATENRPVWVGFIYLMKIKAV
jgi:hypothetical protein